MRPKEGTPTAVYLHGAKTYFCVWFPNELPPLRLVHSLTPRLWMKRRALMARGRTDAAVAEPVRARPAGF